MSSDDIRREIDASRRAIQRDYAACRAELDFVARTKRAMRNRPLPWLGGAAFVGYLLSGRKKRRVRKGRDGAPKSARGFGILGILLGAARLLFPLFRPLITNFALAKLTGLAGKH